jgi:hypothetical protein
MQERPRPSHGTRLSIFREYGVSDRHISASDLESFISSSDHSNLNVDRCPRSAEAERTTFSNGGVFEARSISCFKTQGVLLAPRADRTGQAMGEFTQSGGAESSDQSRYWTAHLPPRSLRFSCSFLHLPASFVRRQEGASLPLCACPARPLDRLMRLFVNVACCLTLVNVPPLKRVRYHGHT